MSVITIGIRRTRRRRRRGKANHFLCVCPHKNAKAVASVFATDDHCSNNNKTEAAVSVSDVCVLMSSPNRGSSFSSLFLFFTSTYENSSPLLSLSLSLVFNKEE